MAPRGTPGGIVDEVLASMGLARRVVLMVPSFLVVPHVVRMWWGVDYRRLIPLSSLGGATVLLLADVLARVVMAPQELPVGVVTALAGAPFFLWVLKRAKNQGLW